MQFKATTKYTFPALFKITLEQHYDKPALTFVDETPLTYSDYKDYILSVIDFLKKLGVEKGDRVAILSSNMPNWGISYFAVTFMGAVVVPLLPDFHSDEIQNVLKHSGAKAIFVSSLLVSKLNDCECDQLESIINIEDFSLVKSIENSIKFELNKNLPFVDEAEEDDLAAIIYTSGTTGKSKGVMLTHKNIGLNAVSGRKVQPVESTDRFLSILPLSHTYENTLGLILPMLGGACVYYLRKAPTPTILLPAMQKVKPTIMLTVPLIIEKIYRNKILPSFTSKKVMRFLYGIPAFRKKLNVVAGKKLMESFGGELKFFGIGGTKLDPTVEKFLLEAKFPYAIGYGLTETSPFLAGVNPQMVRWESTGPVIDAMEIKIHNPDPETGEGEVWAKGPCIMKGYYKEPELTAEVMTKDGWFKTGDLAILDKDNYLYIKGRSKNMIVGSSGENIYPEEIESVINNFKYVIESLVVEQKGKIVAMVHFNREELEKKYHHLKEGVSQFVDNKLEELKRELHEYVNSKVNKFSRIQNVLLHPKPFQKTATQKIKRFLYK